MATEPRNEELEAFAEEVRRVTGRAMSRIGWGDKDAAVMLLSDLCSKAGAIVHSAKEPHNNNCFIFASNLISFEAKM